MDLTFTNDAAMGSGFLWAINRTGYPYVPTVVEADIAWGAERVVTAPEAARATVELWLPDSSRSTHLPRIGQAVRLTVTDDPADEFGSDRANVFVGVVDKVRRARRRAGRYGEPAQRLDLVSVPYRTTTWVQTVGGVSTTVFVYSTDYARTDTGEADLDVLEFRAPVNSPDEEIVLDDNVPLSGRLPLNARVQPHSWIWAVDDAPGPWAPSFGPGVGSPGGPPGPERGASRAWWRANGTYTPVADGAFLIGSTVPADFALVVHMMPGEVRRITTPMVRSTTGRQGLHPPGEWVTITASDHLAAAARHRIGDTPWPVESVHDRLVRIAAAAEARSLPVRFLTVTEFAAEYLADSINTYVDARDVDNVPALDLWAETLSAIGALPIALPEGVGGHRPVEQPIELTALGTTQLNPQTVELPAQLVPEGELETDANGLTNIVRIGYVDLRGAEPVERTLELRDAISVARWGEGAARWSTPVVQRTGDPDDPELLMLALSDRLRNVLAGSAEPAYTFADAVTVPQVILERLEAVSASGARVVQLLDVKHRHGALLHIDHAVPELPRVFCLRGGSLVATREGQLIVTLDPEPAGQSGAPSLRLAMSPATADLTFAQLAAGADPTFAETRYLKPADY